MNHSYHDHILIKASHTINAVKQLAPSLKLPYHAHHTQEARFTIRSVLLWHCMVHETAILEQPSLKQDLCLRLVNSIHFRIVGCGEGH